MKKARTTLGTVGLLVGLAVPSTAPAASADVVRVAVLGVEFSENIPAAVRDLLYGRLVGSLAEPDVLVSAGTAVRDALGHEPGLEACREATCYRRVAARLGAAMIVVGSVAAQQRNYDVRLLFVSHEVRTMGERRAR
jgi:hypothetical protein